jgi:CRP-like cAMP-binding protein/tetratricopeptide (TPR) repeat protein
MADVNPDSSPHIFESPGHSDEFATRFPEQVRAMLTMLRTSKLGGLAVAECDDLHLRRQLFTYFKHRLADEGIYLYPYEVTDKDLNLVRALRDLTQQPRFKNLEFTGKFKSIAIFVHGIEKYNEIQEARFLYLLNFLWNDFNTMEQPVVIWGPNAFVTRLAHSAPDFWSCKKMLLPFPSTLGEYPVSEDTREEREGLRSQLPPLLRYLQAVVEAPDYAVWRDLYLPLKAVRAADTMKLAPPRHTLTDDEMAQLRRATTTTKFHEAGETIFERGTPGVTCYIISSGQVEVLVPDALGNEVVVSTLGPGDFFGEIALLQSVPRTASVRTTESSHFLVLNRRSLGTVSQVAPSVVEILMEISRRRLETRIRDPQELVSPLRRFALEGHSLIRQTPIDVCQLIADDQRVVVLGEAGAGKTTMLRRMVFDLANEGLEALTEPHGLAVVPFFIKLNMLTLERQVEDLILESLHSYGIPEFESREDLAALLQVQDPDTYPARTFVFLMDGLNEMSSQPEVRRELNRFIQEYARHRFVMTCRVQHYAPIARFRTAMLQRLAGNDIESFLSRYLGDDRGRRVAREIYSDPQLEDLAQTPLALYMFAQIAKNNETALPKNRGILFERFTNSLLERIDSESWKTFGRSKGQIPLDIRQSALASLALMMQENKVWAFPCGQWEASAAQELYLYREAVTAEEREAVRSISPQNVMDEVMYSGLLRYSGDGEWVEFAHHTLQEFFGAQALRAQDVDLEPLLRTPESRRHWLGTIVLLYGISHYRPALFFKILGHGNDHSRIWLAAECLANAGGDIAYAAESLEAAIVRSGPVDERQRFGMLFSVGLACRQLERYSEALTYLHRAAELQPGSADVQYELGSLYRLVDQYERAIAHLEEAIRVRPDFVDAYNQLGITYYDQGKYVEALTVFRATTQLEPSNPHHYHNLGTVLKLLRDYPAARNAFQTAVELKPDYIEARTQFDILEKALASGVVRVLDRIPLLSKLTLEQNVLLANRLRVLEFRPGQIVFHMGEIGDTFYIVESGEVEVLAPNVKGSPTVLNRLGRGDFFGEIALLRAVPRTATIRVVLPTRLLALSREDFNDVLTRYTSVAHHLAETSDLRLLRDRQRGRRLDLDRYYDPAYIEELVQQKEVTVVMGDIHGSTFLTNAIGPELMVEFLDEYLLRMSTIVVQVGGAMDRSLGDSVMGVFGSFYERHGDSETTSGARALLAALRMRQAYLDLRAEWSKESPEFTRTGMGIGLSTGSVAKGTVGSETAMVGSAVNLANKLSKLAIKGRRESEIYVDERTYEMLGDSVIAELLDPVYTSRKAGGVPLRAYRIIQRRG